MEAKIQLRHPAGRKAASMAKVRYNLLKKKLLNCLKTNGESTHAEILRTITHEFKNSGTVFQGSVEWHLEWVKLDLEARNKIRRAETKSHVRFALVK